MREASAEAEAGYEAVEAAGVEDFGADFEIPAEILFLFVEEGYVQLGFNLVTLLHRFLRRASRSDAALARGHVSVI